MTSATAKQLRYFQRLAREAGISVGDEELDEFAKLSIPEASAKISGLQQRSGTTAEEEAEEVSEEP